MIPSRGMEDRPLEVLHAFKVYLFIVSFLASYINERKTNVSGKRDSTDGRHEDISSSDEFNARL